MWCIRERPTDRLFPGRLLLDTDVPFDVLQATSSTVREIVVQYVETVETPISGDQMHIRMAQFVPSRWLLSRSEEVLVEKDLTVFELKNLILMRHFNADMDMLDRLEIAKVNAPLIP